ncbi:MAG: YHS domain-containing protein, partial [Planctomycetota bacterium]
MKLLVSLLTLLVLTSCRGPGLFGVGGEPAAAPRLHVNSDGLALRGYDPVAYFAEGGATPRKGDPRRTFEFDGATYRFAREENRDRFA